MNRNHRVKCSVSLFIALVVGAAVRTVAAEPQTSTRFVDLSLLVSPEYPCTWPTFPPMQINPYQRIGPLSPYNSDLLVMDGNTGTQLDVPPHSVTLPNSGLSNAGPYGSAFTNKIPAWQFIGEACVVDCRDLRDAAAPGHSALIKRERLIAWEEKHRPLGAGDAVLFYSGFSDQYYQPLPEGRRFGADPVAGVTPAWPDPDPDCMEFLAERKVMTLATDSTSMGPLPDLAEPTHYAGLKHGMIWTESGTHFGELPTTGALYCMLSPKHANDPYSEGRAFALVGGPLVERLLASARKRQVVDLSVTLAEDWPCIWPGQGVGNHRQPYMTIRFGMNRNTKTPFVMHMMDSQAGTHLVPPAYALPRPGFDNSDYSPTVQQWLKEYEAKYGERGTSELTTEKISLEQTCGRARVIDVRRLAGSTKQEAWPASPEISVADIERYEQEQGELKAGDIVVFQTGWSNRYYQALPEGRACLDEPLNGKREGWPAPGPEAIRYLAGKKIRCVGIDGPTLGGVEAKRALMTYWALGTAGMVGVEFLANLERLPQGAYFLFAATKIKGCHGGPGRAIALY